MVYFQRVVFRKGCRLEMLEEKIRELYRITAELEEKYPGRCFTPDGHLVGSIGEVYAAEKYGLTLLEASSEKHDATSADGRLVQIKITQTDRVSIYSEPDYLIVMKMKHDGSIVEIPINGSIGTLQLEEAGLLWEKQPIITILMKVSTWQMLLSPHRAGDMALARILY